jgi:hypothetical protein
MPPYSHTHNIRTESLDLGVSANDTAVEHQRDELKARTR